MARMAATPVSDLPDRVQVAIAGAGLGGLAACAALRRFRKTLVAHTARIRPTTEPLTIAAIMAESVVGSGGVFVHPPGYMQGVRALCDKYGILYIADEGTPRGPPGRLRPCDRRR